MNLVPLASTFAVVALAELGDKTQIVSISLSAKRSSLSVFLGAMLAFLVVDGLSVVLGDALASFLPIRWIALISGLVFVAFGVHTLISKGEREIKFKERGFSLATSFSLVTLMELGDKTQFAVIALAAKFSSPVLVFIGTMLAFLVTTGIGIFFGAKFLRLLPTKYVNKATSALFIFFGIIFIAGSLTGINIL